MAALLPRLGVCALLLVSIVVRADELGTRSRDRLVWFVRVVVVVIVIVIGVVGRGPLLLAEDRFVVGSVSPVGFEGTSSLGLGFSA